MKKGTGILIVFLVILLLPVYAWCFDGRFALKGVSQSAASAPLSMQSLMDGSAQASLGDRFSERMGGRNLLIRIHNQILYSVFHVSPNANVVITEGDYLFEPSYLENYLGLSYQMTDGDTDALLDKLEALEDLLRENGQQLYVFISPSKARYVSTKYRNLSTDDVRLEGRVTDYDRFLARSADRELNIYDSIAYIDSIKDGCPFPLFYKGGTHWSNVLGNTVAADFANWLTQRSGYDLTRLSVSSAPCGSPVFPDSDLLDTLNVFRGSREPYYAPVITKTHSGTDAPSVFLRGGSFMGQSLSLLIREKVFGDDFHFENNYYFTDDYSFQKTLSGFGAYGEVESLGKEVGEKDILILEVNESVFSRMSFGFIDHLLAHPEYFSRGGSAREEASEPSVRVVGAEPIDTAINPWGFTAGRIVLPDEGEGWLLTPGTALEIRAGADETYELTTMIHPWVESVSDGAGIVLTCNGVTEKYPVTAEPASIVIQGDAYVQWDNGGSENQDGDWVVVQVIFP